MKMIYRKKSKNIYEKGIFITNQVIYGLLAFFVFIISALILLLVTQFEIKIGLYIIFIFTFLYLSSKSLTPKDIINLNPNEYRGIDINSYIEKKIKKRKNESHNATLKKLTKRTELIGDYESSVIFNGKELLEFYKNCKSELNIITNKGREKLNMDTLISLENKLNSKIANYEKLYNK